MNKAQIARLTDSRRRAIIRAERALAVGDVVAAEFHQHVAEKLSAKIAEIKDLAAAARRSERQAQADAAQAAVADREYWCKAARQAALKGVR